MSIIGNPIMAGASGPAASIFVTGLSETDTVTATNGSKTLTGKWAQKLNPAYHGLPDGYTELEYIESTGTQYIDTGVYLDANYLVELDAYLPDTNGSSFVVLFGADNNSNNRFIVASENSRMNAIFCSDSWTDYTQYTQNQRHKIVYDLSNTQSLSVDGVLFGTKTNAISTAIFPLALFALNRNNSIICQAKFRCYGFRISNGQSHLLNFIPAKRNSDGAIGMYDLVTATFFENDGTGEFVAGSEIPQTFDGFLIKPIRDFGTWTVTATNGTKTATQDVLVDVITEYVIEMSYKLYLYRDGDECEDVTGGWTANGYTRNGYTVYAGTKESDALKISLSSSSGSQMCILGTNIAIDFSGYSKCCIEYLVSATNTYNPTIAAKTTKAAESTALFAKYGSSNFTANVTKILEIDISSVNGSGYFEWYCTNVATHRIYRVWLE